MRPFFDVSALRTLLPTPSAAAEQTNQTKSNKPDGRGLRNRHQVIVSSDEVVVRTSTKGLFEEVVRARRGNRGPQVERVVDILTSGFLGRSLIDVDQDSGIEEDRRRIGDGSAKRAKFSRR